MRISDWSSDVCSSDLLAANTDLRVAAANLERARAITREVRAVSDVQTSLDGSASVGEASNLGIGNPAGVHDLFSLGGSISYEVDVVEIGRASCRERVCQYV